jgi:hypothetical protein
MSCLVDRWDLPAAGLIEKDGVLFALRQRRLAPAPSIPMKSKQW